MHIAMPRIYVCIAGLSIKRIYFNYSKFESLSRWWTRCYFDFTYKSIQTPLEDKVGVNKPQPRLKLLSAPPYMIHDLPYSTKGLGMGW
jgi:hypothetical protein